MPPRGGGDRGARTGAPLRGLLAAFDAAGAPLVAGAAVEAVGLGRAGLLTPAGTALALFWSFELWACSLAASRRLMASGRVHVALATALLPTLALACEAGIDAWARTAAG